MQFIGEYLRQSNVISVFIRLLLAAACGGIIGLERGRMKQAAGMRTHMLVCIGAAMVMLAGQYTVQSVGAGDPTRIGAQVVSGIGFLGAGTIIVSERERVKGLTTAAGLWASSCIGLCLGIGFYACGITGTVIVALILTKAKKLEHRLILEKDRFRIYMEMDAEAKMADIAHNMEAIGLEIDEVSVLKKRKNDVQKVILTIESISHNSRKQILKQLEKMGEIQFVKFAAEDGE